MVSTLFKKALFLFSIMVLTIIATTAMAATITATADRNPVQQDESFQLVFTADGKVDADPDFRALEKDFDILSRNQSNSMQFINGQMTQKIQWMLTVMAKRSGTLTIPAVKFGRDQSSPFKITVNKARSSTSSSGANSADLFLEVDAQPINAYVQSQIVYTVRFFRAVNINGASLSEPKLNTGDAIIEKLGDDNTFETRRNGRRFVVIERRYAIFPQQSGAMVLEPITLEAQILQTSSNSIFDPFTQNVRTKRLQSKAIAIDIKPVPTNAQTNTWLPARDVKISEQWSEEPLSFTVGEPITRTLTLNADGLTAAQLPTLSIGDSPDFKAYPDQPRLNDRHNGSGVTGTRQEKIALIPTQAGTLTLPTIEIPWWNTKTNKMEVAKLPAKTVQVAPGQLNNQTPQFSQPATTTTVDTHTDLPIPIAASTDHTWQWLSLALALGWALTVIAWVYRNKNSSPIKTNSEPQTQRHASLNKVKKACLSNNAQLTKTLLLDWARGQWPQQPPTSLGEIGNRLSGMVSDEIAALNQALYHANPEHWQGEPLWQALSSNLPQQKTEKKENIDVLAPLYP